VRGLRTVFRRSTCRKRQPAGPLWHFLISPMMSVRDDGGDNGARRTARRPNAGVPEAASHDREGRWAYAVTPDGGRMRITTVSLRGSCSVQRVAYGAVSGEASISMGT